WRSRDGAPRRGDRRASGQPECSRAEAPLAPGPPALPGGGPSAARVHHGSAARAPPGAEETSLATRDAGSASGRLVVGVFTGGGPGALALLGQRRWHHLGRGTLADLADCVLRHAAERRIVPVGNMLQRLERSLIADVAEREDRVAADGAITVAREEVEDRLRRLGVADLSERHEEVLLGHRLRVAHEELLDERCDGVLRTHLTEHVDGLQADRRVGVVGPLQQVSDGLRLVVDVAELPAAYEACRLVVGVEVAQRLVELGLRRGLRCGAVVPIAEPGASTGVA